MGLNASPAPLTAALAALAALSWIAADARAAGEYDGVWSGKFDCTWMQSSTMRFVVKDGRIAEMEAGRMRGAGQTLKPNGTFYADHSTSRGPMLVNGEFHNGAYKIVASGGNQARSDYCTGTMTRARPATQEAAAPPAPAPVPAPAPAPVPAPQAQPAPAPPPPAAPPKTEANQNLQVEMAFWDAIKDSDRPEDYQAYLQTYPKGRFAALARARATPRGKPEQTAAAPAPGPPPAAAEALLKLNFGQYHALVIGNNEYKHLARLQTAVNDARGMADVLAKRYGFEVTALENATRHEILGALAGLRVRLKDTDNLLIYYAGHGYLDQGVDTGYWLPVDADRDSPANWIANADVTTAIRALRAKHVMIVADSCYAGTLVRSAGVVPPQSADRVEWLKRITQKRARTVMASGGAEPVVDGGGGGHSVFARSLLDALNANSGVMEGQELFSRIKRGVVLNSQQTPEYSDIRQAGHDGGDFIFVPRR